MGNPVCPDIRQGVFHSRSPWAVDVNHAPPGAGYLHLLYILFLQYPPGFAPSAYSKVLERCTPNRFIQGGFPTDLRNAKLRARLKGEVNLRGAQLVLLAQGNVAKTADGQPDWKTPNYVAQMLTAQPFHITPDWSEQTITLVPDQKQWTSLRARHGLEAVYGDSPVEEVLREIYDIIFVLFPLDVRPLRPLSGDPHRLKAGLDYEVDPAYLPEGHVMLDEVRIEFA
jgi:hypothetical protein